MTRGARHRLALVTALVFGLTVVMPIGVPTSKVGFPVSWLWPWLRPEQASAVPLIDGTPKQWSATAEGKEHHVSGSATTATGGGFGLPPGKGIGALAPYTASVQEVKQTATPSLDGMGIMAAVAPQVDAQYPPTGYATPTPPPALLLCRSPRVV